MESDRIWKSDPEDVAEIWKSEKDREKKLEEVGLS